MKQRILTGLIAALLLLALIFRGPGYSILLVVIACANLSYFEYDRLFFSSSSWIRQIRMAALVTLGIGALWTSPWIGWTVFWSTFCLMGALSVFAAEKSGDFAKVTKEFALEVVGYVYVLSLFGFLTPISELPNGRQLLFLLFLLVFFGDTAAYFVGMFFGKHRLAPHLSPKKSIEGAIGALVVTTLVAFLWVKFAPHEKMDFITEDQGYPFGWKIMLFAPLASVLAQTGDLLESLFKRSQAQKDSGHLLPGHGGMLDRVDGLALVAPIYFFYLLFVVGPR
jgi:phosphatidate cytidylyltransferase